jgi:hypothetical protein
MAEVTESNDQPRAPGEFHIPPDALKTVLQFSLRLLLAYAVLIGLIQLMTPLIELLIARGARNLLSIASSAYYLKTVEFIDGGYVFTTWIGPLLGSFKMPTLLFTLGFPIGYALSLPGIYTVRYWLQVLATVVTSFFVCAIAVAVVSDVRLTSTFLQFGITLQPEWRIEVSRFVGDHLWMFTVRLYPLLVVLVLALASGQIRQVSSSMIHRLNQVLGWGAVIVLVPLLIACIGYDSTANERLASVAEESISKRIEGLEKLNPKIGPGLVELAEYLVKQENDRAAMNMLRLAMTKLKGTARRNAQLQLDVVHERIKADMLEGARLRREGMNPDVPSPRL